MQTIDEAREHCWFVGEGIGKMVADGDAPLESRPQTGFTVCKL